MDWRVDLGFTMYTHSQKRLDKVLMWLILLLLCWKEHTCDYVIIIDMTECDEVGGVAHVEMLQRSNILAVVGGGRYPKYPDKKC